MEGMRRQQQASKFPFRAVLLPCCQLPDSFCVCWLLGGARCSACPASREKFAPGVLQPYPEHRCEPKPPALTSLLLQP